MRALVLSSGAERVAGDFSTELTMKFLIRLFVFALVLLLILGLIAAFLPASVALGWMEGRMGGVKLENVSGSVWNGRAEQLTVRERPLGAASWSISPWALLSRRLDADVTVDGPELKAAGFVSIDKPGNLQLRSMQLSLDAQRMQPALDIPALQLRGKVDFDLREVVVVQYFPTRIEGSAVWRDAAVTGAADALLGEIRSEFATQADGRSRAGASRPVSAGSAPRPPCVPAMTTPRCCARCSMSASCSPTAARVCRSTAS
jgi:general secretion pathway protein N